MCVYTVCVSRPMCVITASTNRRASCAMSKESAGKIRNVSSNAIRTINTHDNVMFRYYDYILYTLYKYYIL